MLRGSKKFKKGAGVEIAILFMLVAIAFGFIIMSITLHSQFVSANAVRRLQSRLALDSIAQKFINSPTQFEPSDYAEDFSIIVTHSGDEIAMNIYKKNKKAQVIADFLKNPISGIDIVAASSLASCTVAVDDRQDDAAIVLTMYDGTACILELAVSLLQNEGEYVVDQDGNYIVTVLSWSFDDSAGEGTLLTYTHNEGGEKKWSEIYLDSLLQTKITTDGKLLLWRYSA